MIHSSSVIETGAFVDVDATVWGNSHIRSGASVGAGTSIGTNVYIGPGVRIGENCKIQNSALLYEPSQISDSCFVGPGVIFTNDERPRAVNFDGSAKTASDWSAVAVILEEGASVGAGAICVAPVTIGKWAMVAAGAVVTSHVPPHALVVGVPAKLIGYVCKCGERLIPSSEHQYSCPIDRSEYLFSEISNSIEI